MSDTRPVWLRPELYKYRWVKIHLYPDCRLFENVSATDIRRTTMGEALAEGRAVCFFCGKREEREG